MRSPVSLLAAITLAACAAPAPAPAPSCPAPVPCPACAVAEPTTSASALASAAPAPAPPRTAAPRLKPTVRLFDRSEAEPGFFARGDAFALGLDGKVLDALVAEAEKTKSDSLIVLKDGQVVVERYFGEKRGPIETMSITKSFSALAVMMLIEQGKIPSLDTPLARYIPEFKGDRRSQITLRQVMTHTSGLNGKDVRALNSQKDRNAYARKAELVAEPGAEFAYNNTASQLLSLVIEQAAGKPVDAYLDERLFRPLGIKSWAWNRDEARTPATYFGLSLDARAMARVGQLLLDQGALDGKPLLAKESVEKISTPSEKNPNYGLLWWIRHERTVHEIDPAELARLDPALQRLFSPVAGKPFASPESLWISASAQLSDPDRAALAALLDAGNKPVRSRPDHKIGFYAEGSLGQRLVVLPDQRLVAVRQRRRRPAAEESESLSFSSMLRLLQGLASGVLRCSGLQVLDQGLRAPRRSGGKGGRGI